MTSGELEVILKNNPSDFNLEVYIDGKIKPIRSCVVLEDLGGRHAIRFGTE